jgi:hypothetical protein
MPDMYPGNQSTELTSLRISKQAQAHKIRSETALTARVSKNKNPLSQRRAPEIQRHLIPGMLIAQFAGADLGYFAAWNHAQKIGDIQCTRSSNVFPGDDEDSRRGLRGRLLLLGEGLPGARMRKGWGER